MGVIFWYIFDVGVWYHEGKGDADMKKKPTLSDIALILSIVALTISIINFAIRIVSVLS